MQNRPKIRRKITMYLFPLPLFFYRFCDVPYTDFARKFHNEYKHFKSIYLGSGAVQTPGVRIIPNEKMPGKPQRKSRALQKCANLQTTCDIVRTFGILYFPLGGLPERSNWTQTQICRFLIGKLSISSRKAFELCVSSAIQ